MITHVWVSNNRLIGIHFAELTNNKMSDTEEVVEEEEAQYVHTSVTSMHYSVFYIFPYRLLV